MGFLALRMRLQVVKVGDEEDVSKRTFKTVL